MSKGANRVVSSVSQSSLLMLMLCLVAFCSLPTYAALQLTNEEQVYLAQHPVIKIANDPQWEPFEYVDEDGRLAGVVADYVALFEQKLGVRFDYVLNEPWSVLTEQVKTGERPVVMARHATDERKQYLNFTKSYMSFPVVIVGREGEDYVGSAQQLAGQLVAGVKGFNATAYLRKQHPEVPMLEVFSIQEGLTAVVTNRVYAFVANLGSVNYAIKHHGIDGLKIIGQLAINADLAIGVHKDDPMLFSILQKALADVSPAEAQAIYDRWFQLRAVSQLDRRQLWQLGLYAFAVFVGLFLFMLWMRHQQRKQQAYINQVHEYSLATLIDLQTMKIVWSSHAYARLVGCKPRQLLDKSAVDLSGATFTPERLALVMEMVKSGQIWSGECDGVGCDGRLFWTLLTLTPHKNWCGKITQVWATRVDITDKKRIEQLSVIDELTGLYNRRQFNVVLEQEMRRAKREHHSLFLATFDIDFFKFINDVYGHQQGDEALKSLGELLKTHFSRANDHVFRMGGEEFMLITSCECHDSFVAYLESLRQQVFELGIPNERSEFQLMTISIGACYWQDLNRVTVDLMYQRVDQCLYQAKLQGRNRLVMCDSLSS